jgi:hypothetical protein
VVDLSVCKAYKYHLSGQTIVKKKFRNRELERKTIFIVILPELCKTCVFSFNGEIALLKFVVCI